MEYGTKGSLTDKEFSELVMYFATAKIPLDVHEQIQRLLWRFADYSDLFQKRKI